MVCDHVPVLVKSGCGRPPGESMRVAFRRLRVRLRRLTARSWLLSRCRYRLRGARLAGRPNQLIWYFAYGANMDEATFCGRRGMRPFERRTGRIAGYRLRFNLDGRPRGRSAPANLFADPDAEVWGVLYRIARRDLLRLDATEGVPGTGYRHVALVAEDTEGRQVPAIAYLAHGKETDGRPSPRYIALLRAGARAHGLPPDYVRFLDSVEDAG